MTDDLYDQVDSETRHRHGGRGHDHAEGNIPHAHNPIGRESCGPPVPEEYEGYGRSVATGSGIGLMIFGGLMWLVVWQMSSQCVQDIGTLATCSGLPAIAFTYGHFLTIVAIVLIAVGALTFAGTMHRD
jgi:hypothetical protein